MRTTVNPPKPTTGGIKSIPGVQKALLRAYPERLFRGVFGQPSGDTITFEPQDIGRGKSCMRFGFEIGEELYHVRDDTAWSFDLDTAAINLTNRTSGVIDGLTQEVSRTYLLWALLDANFEFAGLGLTRKPYSTFSAIGAGSANKGTSGKVFTVPSNASSKGFQFTVGARVVVRNDVGTANFYEWNWATVTAVANTSVTLTMDNVSTYGTNITGTTNGVIEQWASFRPYIVSTSAQTIYSPYYCLLGEVYTSTGGNIVQAYRADQEWRHLHTFVFTASGTVALANYSFARWVPLWSQAFDMRLLISAATQLTTFIEGPGLDIVAIRSGAINQLLENNGVVSCYGNAIVSIDINATTYIDINAYFVPGGMRG